MHLVHESSSHAAGKHSRVVANNRSTPTDLEETNVNYELSHKLVVKCGDSLGSPTQHFLDRGSFPAELTWHAGHIFV